VGVYLIQHWVAGLALMTNTISYFLKDKVGFIAERKEVSFYFIFLILMGVGLIVGLAHLSIIPFVDNIHTQ
jgi:DMSO reductase anchor subunit